MTQTFKIELTNHIYKVTIFKNMAGRWGIKHPSYRIHHKDFASDNSQLQTIKDFIEGF